MAAAAAAAADAPAPAAAAAAANPGGVVVNVRGAEEGGEHCHGNSLFGKEEKDEGKRTAPLSSSGTKSNSNNHWLSSPLVLGTLAVLAVALQVGLWVLLGTHRGGGGDDDEPPVVVVGSALVRLNYTAYRGLRLSNGVSAFLGMRYAAPPLGPLRWRAPVPIDLAAAAAPPDAVEDATEFPPICLGINAGYPSPGQDEDCLFANVWTPANATPRSRLPVWVFIQGGGYVANTNANWDGAEVVEKSGHSIVMVNFNYRVGLWGFLASERVRADGALNAGLLDQRMLLWWVKRHIASFGGDPDHVVVHGASAGAGSVAMHLVAYGGRDDGLFVGGMAESVFFPAQPFVRELEYQFDRLAAQTGCADADADAAPADQMACLRAADVAVLQAANRAQPFPGRPEPPMPLFYWTPCVDGDFLRDLPYRLFASGQFVSVPMLFGTSTNEGSVFAANAATQADVATFLANNYPGLTRSDTDDVLARYPKLPPLPRHDAWFPTASQAYGEATFICPQTNLLDALHASSRHRRRRRSSSSSNSSRNATATATATARPAARLFAYRYNVHDDENAALGLGVPHLFDAAAIFGPDSIRGGGGTGRSLARASYWTYNAPVVPLMMGYWISFVRALNPNPHRLPGSPAWAEWRAAGGSAEDDHGDGEGGVEGEGEGESESGRWTWGRLVVETGNTRMESTPVDERERCLFWLGLGDRMRQKRGVGGEEEVDEYGYG